MRKPIAATVARPIPSLAAVLAGAAASQGCAHVECGETRADEVRAHGPRAVDAVRSASVRDTAREVAIAAGLLPHTRTQVETGPRAGAIASVNPAPTPNGGPMLVTPASPTPPTPPSIEAPPTPPARVQPARRRATPRIEHERVVPPREDMVTAGAPMKVGPRGE